MTLLLGGLGWPYDDLVAAAVSAAVSPCGTLGALDRDAFERGRAALPRGQCAPALYTTGALLRTAATARERATYLALGSCGPCRFSMFDATWRRALGQTAIDVRSVASDFESLVDTFGPGGASAAIEALLAADGLGEVIRRLRPHVRDPDALDELARQVSRTLGREIAAGVPPLRALRGVRGWHAPIARAPTPPLARVALVGEPWSLHVEGDPQLNVARVLAHASVEVDAPPLALWLAYLLWSARVPWSPRAQSPHAAQLARTIEDALPDRIAAVADASGLTGFAVPSIDELAELSAPYLPASVRGGYGHVEVGLALRAVRDRRAHAVVSVKSFGCVPSGGVSDAILPAALGDMPYLALEVCSDGEAARESRLMLRISAARAAARAELAEATRGRPDVALPALDPLADPWFAAKRPFACTLASALVSA